MMRTLSNRTIITAAFVLVLTACPAYAFTKADPLLVQLYNAVNSVSPGQALSPHLLTLNAVGASPSGDIMVNVLLRTTAPHTMTRFIVNHQGSVGTSINGILTATVPLSLVPSLAENGDLNSIQISRTLHPLLDISVPDVQGNLVHTGDNGILPRPYTGKNVIIGVIDTGLDLTHTDFLYPDGSTRVIALWDQTETKNPPAGYSYGNECTGYDINAGQCPEIDTVGHGTHVTGIADSSNSKYTGMAPDAMLVIVKTNMQENEIVDGISYIFSLASRYQVPAVINMSLGAQYYAHDNSSATEQAIDGLVNGAPGRAVVVAAGNDGANPIHIGLTAVTGTTYASYFSVVSVVSGSVNTAELQAWYYTTTTTNSDLAFAVGVVDPSTGAIIAATPFTTPTDPSAQALSASLANYGYATIEGGSVPVSTTTEGQNEVIVQISDNGSSTINLANSTSSYRYVLLVQNNSPFAQPLNGWFDSENALFDTMTTTPVSGYQLIKGDTSDTVSFPATARSAIAVGSFVTRNDWPTEASTTQPACITLDGVHCYEPPIGSLSFFSSKGPTPNPTATGIKPDITAPGEVIVSALSAQASFPADQITPDGQHLADLGTSMACPHVTGAVALLFDRNDALDITQTMSVLGSSATTNTYTGSVPNNEWGSGMLNALNLVQTVSETPTPTTGPVITDVNMDSVSTSGATITWATDRLSSSHVSYWIASDPTGTTLTTGTTTMTEAHRVDLTGLKAHTSYAYQVISTDPYGNTSIYPAAGALSFATRENKSSGCMCEQSAGPFNAGDLLPYLLLFLGWLVCIKLFGRKDGLLP